MASKSESVTLVTELSSTNSTKNEPSGGPTFTAWPTNPKPLLLSHTEKVLRGLYDIDLILMPVLLMRKQSSSLSQSILTSTTPGSSSTLPLSCHGSYKPQRSARHALHFVAYLVLLAAAVWSFWLRVHTLAPDVFGYVSSLTRDNPNIRLPTEGSTLDGLDRARYLKGVKVKIGDLVGESTGAGKIGLAPADQIQHLQKGKIYV